MSLISEFKEFINKGNVMDLAVALILGQAFQKIVDSIVNDIIMPIIATIGGFSSIESLHVGPFTYGKLIAATLNFIIIAIVLFMMIKAMNRIKRRNEIIK
ncbi:MAG: large conductance mechanosensitive channel protein MscL [Bacteroidia bacterium]|nr:large conductance mechanosensitive channel protein MscL [Bacteroidia bacterium]